MRRVGCKGCDGIEASVNLGGCLCNISPRRRPVTKRISISQGPITRNKLRRTWMFLPVTPIGASLEGHVARLDRESCPVELFSLEQLEFRLRQVVLLWNRRVL